MNEVRFRTLISEFRVIFRIKEGYFQKKNYGHDKIAQQLIRNSAGDQLGSMAVGLHKIRLRIHEAIPFNFL